MGYFLLVYRLIFLIPAYLVLGWVGLLCWVVLGWSPRRRHQALAFLTRLWARISLFFFNIRVKVVGEVHADPRALIVSNHVGTPDIFVLGSCFNASFVSKAEIARWPVLSWLARLGATIFVDRTKRREARKIVTEIQKRLGEECSVVLFPEGGTTDGRAVAPFKSSPFEAAVNSGRPVLPVAIRYHDKRTPSIACWYQIPFIKHLTALLKNPKLEVTVHILPPITGEKERRVLADKCFQIIHQAFQNPDENNDGSNEK